MAGEHHLLLYDYVENVPELRGPYREAHLARIHAGQEAGTIVMAGALGDPPHGAAIVFTGVSRAEIEAELVTKWYIERWNLV
jgi:uncharacterized protein YciI